MKSDNILSKLEFYRRTGDRRWIARCPAHKDSSPSLVITQPDDDRVLIHCHAGCAPGDILAALGLSWSALMPEKNYPATRFRADDRQFQDSLTIAIGRAMIERGERMTEADKSAVLSAKIRLLRSV